MLPIKDDKNYFKSKIYLVLLAKCTLWRRNYVTRVRKINLAERIPQTKFPHATLIVIVHSHTRMWERVHDLQNERKMKNVNLQRKNGKVSHGKEMMFFFILWNCSFLWASSFVLALL